jgi:peroxiredoxin
MGDSALSFTLPDTSGNFVSLDDFSGDVILLNFFAHWCVPCYTEGPLLEDSIWNAYKNRGITVLGLGHMSTNANIQFFSDSTHVTYPLLKDTAATIFNNYGVPFLPHNYIIDQTGIVAYVDGVSGFNIRKLVNVVDSLVNISDIINGTFDPHQIDRLEIYPAFPNPFNSIVKLNFRILKPALVTISVFDITGKRVSEISQHFGGGIQSLSLELNNISSGVYFYSIKALDKRKIGKFILQK